jgi:hypothetical protein
MYFEPTKKTYYRFPSVNSINDLDAKYYFPDKSHASEEDTRFEAQITGIKSNQETYFDI